MYSVISVLKESECFDDIQVIEFVDEESVKLLKIRASVADGSVLYITELATYDYQKYSYHWQKDSGELIARWDNSPHWKNISTFPHHKHEKDKVLPCNRITPDEVIKEIKKKLKLS